MNPRHPVPAAALDKHVAILGKTGSGKSNLAKTIVEDLLARDRRVCVLDPTGTWWGLRLLADGRTPSDNRIAIFGGEHADLPIEPEHGRAVAHALATTATSAILDLRKLGVAGRTRFFTDFAETLVADNRGKLHLFLDEAHVFMPQAGARGGGRSPAMLHAGNDLVSLGRGIGLRITLITQRPAKLHKDALTQIDTLVAMRLTAPQDRNAIDEWVRETTHDDAPEVKSSLPSLATGEAWIWSPEIDHLARAQSPLAATFDSGQLNSLDHVALPRVDIDQIAAKLGNVHDELQANDPVRLRRRIAELERRLQDAPADRLDVVRRHLETARAEHRGNLQHLRDGIARLSGDLSDLETGLDSTFGRLLATLDGQREPSPAVRPSAETLPAPPAQAAATVPATPPSPGPAATDAPPLTAPRQRILDALAWLRAVMRQDTATRGQVAFVARYKPSGGAFNNHLGALRTAGLVDYPSNGTVRLTPQGGTLATAPETPQTTDDLQRALMEKLSGPQRRVLQPLVDSYPRPLTVQELASAASYDPNGGAFNNTRGSLRSFKLIDYPHPGTVVALPVLFR